MRLSSQLAGCVKSVSAALPFCLRPMLKLFNIVRLCKLWQSNNYCVYWAGGWQTAVLAVHTSLQAGVGKNEKESGLYPQHGEEVHFLLLLTRRQSGESHPQVDISAGRRWGQPRGTGRRHHETGFQQHQTVHQQQCRWRQQWRRVDRSKLFGRQGSRAQRPPSPPAQQIKKSDWKDVQSVGPHQRPLGQRGRLCVEWRRGWRVQGWEAPPVAQVQVTSPPPHQASPLQASSSSEQVSESSRSISHLVGSMVAFWVCKVLLFTIQVIIIKIIGNL